MDCPTTPGCLRATPSNPQKTKKGLSGQIFFWMGCPLCPVRTGQPGKLGIQGAEGVEGINSLRRLAVWGQRGWRKPCHEVMRTALFWHPNVCAQRGSQVRISGFSFFDVRSVVWMPVKWCWVEDASSLDVSKALAQGTTELLVSSVPPFLLSCHTFVAVAWEFTLSRGEITRRRGCE